MATKNKYDNSYTIIISFNMRLFKLGYHQPSEFLKFLSDHAPLRIYKSLITTLAYCNTTDPWLSKLPCTFDFLKHLDN